MDAPLPDPSSVTSPDLMITMLKSGFIMIAVLALMIGVLLFIRRMVYQRSGLAGFDAIRILASFPVSPKGRIMLVSVMGQKMLIGVTAHSVTFLTRIEAEDLPEANDIPEVPNFFGKLFRSHS